MTAQTKTPERVQAQPGLDSHYACAASIQNSITTKGLAPYFKTGCATYQINRLRSIFGFSQDSAATATTLHYLRRLHGLTEAQANALVFLIFGAS